jgi:WD40 repeat protein
MKQLHVDGVTNLLRSPRDPSVVLTTSYGGEWRCWRAEDYAPLTAPCTVAVAGHVLRATPIMHASWSPDGRYLALSSFHHARPGAELTLERNYSFITVYDLDQGLGTRH